MAVATAILNGNFPVLTETEELQRLLGTGQVLLYIGKLSLHVNLCFYLLCQTFLTFHKLIKKCVKEGLDNNEEIKLCIG